MNLEGRVESLAPATGAQFSILPPENATGNFTKIVQRIPVRIGITGTPSELARLSAGLSAYVSVDTASAVAAIDQKSTVPTSPQKQSVPEAQRTSEVKND